MHLNIAVVFYNVQHKTCSLLFHDHEEKPQSVNITALASL